MINEVRLSNFRSEVNFPESRKPRIPEAERGPRIPDLDYLRGFAIVAVILIHTTGRLWWSPYTRELNGLVLGNTFLHSFSLFAVPLFVCISGFLLAFRYPEKRPLKRFFQKRLSSVLVPYLIFSSGYILFFMGIGALAFDLKKATFKILTASASFHFWFFAILFQFYLLYPLIRRFNILSKRSPVTYLLIFALAQILWGALYGFAEKAVQESREAQILPQVFEFVEPRIFLSHVFYFGLGIYVAGNWEAIRARVKNLGTVPLLTLSGAGVVLTGALAFVGMYPSFPGDSFGPGLSLVLDSMRILFCTLIFVLVFRSSIRMTERKNRFAGIMDRLGKYSFGIFLIHALYLKIVPAGLERLQLSGNNWLFYPLLFGMTLGLSYFSVRGISYLSFSELIIGGWNPGRMSRTAAPEPDSAKRMASRVSINSQCL